MKKYYALTASMIFEKTILVPVDSVKDIDEAIDCVDAALSNREIILLYAEPKCEIKTYRYADSNGICEMSDEKAKRYEIVKGECHK